MTDEKSIEAFTNTSIEISINQARIRANHIISIFKNVKDKEPGLNTINIRLIYKLNSYEIAWLTNYIARQITFVDTEPRYESDDDDENLIGDIEDSSSLLYYYSLSPNYDALINKKSEELEKLIAAKKDEIDVLLMEKEKLKSKIKSQIGCSVPC
jgi:hypothetical protein